MSVFGVERVADHQRLGVVDEGADVVVVDVLQHVEALGRGADLAGVQEGGPGAAAGGDLDASSGDVGADDERVLAAHLEVDPRDALGRTRAPTFLPVSTEPVNAMQSTRSSAAIAAPTSPAPATRLTTPGGQVVEAAAPASGSRAGSARRACRRWRCRRRAPAPASRRAAAAGSSRARCSRRRRCGSLSTSASWVDSIERDHAAGRVAADLGVVVERRRGPADLVGVLDQRLAALLRHHRGELVGASPAAARRPRAASRRARPAGVAPHSRAASRAAAIAASSCSGEAGADLGDRLLGAGVLDRERRAVPVDLLAADQQPRLYSTAGTSGRGQDRERDTPLSARSPPSSRRGAAARDAA